MQSLFDPVARGAKSWQAPTGGRENKSGREYALALIRELISIKRPAVGLAGALAVLISVCAPAYAQRKPAPAQADPAKPALVGQFGDWGAFATPQSKARTCYALSQPKTRMPANLTRDPAYIFVSHRPAEKVRNEIAIIMGFDVKPDSNPMAEIGDEKFELVAKGPNLWLRNASDEAKFIAGMRKGARLVLKAHSMRNNLTTDTYSLSGIAQALDRSLKECP